MWIQGSGEAPKDSSHVVLPNKHLTHSICTLFHQQGDVVNRWLNVKIVPLWALLPMNTNVNILSWQPNTAILHANSYSPHISSVTNKTQASIHLNQDTLQWFATADAMVSIGTFSVKPSQETHTSLPYVTSTLQAHCGLIAGIHLLRSCCRFPFSMIPFKNLNAPRPWSSVPLRRWQHSQDILRTLRPSNTPNIATPTQHLTATYESLSCVVSSSPPTKRGMAVLSDMQQTTWIPSQPEYSPKDDHKKGHKRQQLSRLAANGFAPQLSCKLAPSKALIYLKCAEYPT